MTIGWRRQSHDARRILGANIKWKFGLGDKLKVICEYIYLYNVVSKCRCWWATIVTIINKYRIPNSMKSTFEYYSIAFPIISALNRHGPFPFDPFVLQLYIYIIISPSQLASSTRMRKQLPCVYTSLAVRLSAETRAICTLPLALYNSLIHIKPWGRFRRHRLTHCWYALCVALSLTSSLIVVVVVVLASWCVPTSILHNLFTPPSAPRTTTCQHPRVANSARNNRGEHPHMSQQSTHTNTQTHEYTYKHKSLRITARP